MTPSASWGPSSPALFPGAGTIIRHRGSGHGEGLTTAASVLFAAAIGVALALSQGWLAIGLIIIVLIILRGLNHVRRQITDRTAGGEEEQQ